MTVLESILSWIGRTWIFLLSLLNRLGSRWQQRLSRPPYQEFSIPSRDFVLQGLRYPAPGGRPVLLVHGTLENTRIWSDLGGKLRERGFDVWMVNLRGKGNGAHRSTVQKYVRGRYGFDYMVTEDGPAMIRHVYARTGQKVVVAGHSLGAMVLAKTLAGVARVDGALGVDKGQVLEMTRKTACLISLGGPVHFRNLPETYRWLGRLLKPVTAAAPVGIPSLSGNRAPTQPDRTDFSARGRRFLLSATDLATALVLPRGIMDTRNLDPGRREFTRFREKALSPFHIDLADDLARWAKTGSYTSADGFDYEGAQELLVPTLMVAGENDEIAPAQSAFHEAALLNAQAVVRTALMRGTSHVDLVYGARAARLLAGVLADFVRDPVSFGKHGSPVLIEE